MEVFGHLFSDEKIETRKVKKVTFPRPGLVSSRAKTDQNLGFLV